jgi:spore germination protein YaaH
MRDYEVVGFLPYWIKGYQPKYEYLTHIAWFAVEVNADGTLSNPYGWPPTELINEAHNQGVEVILTVKSFDKDIIDSVLAYYSIKVSNNLLILLKNGNGDGIVIDFEGIRAINTYTGQKNDALLVQFIQILSNTLKKANPSYYVSIALPPVDWTHVFDCSNLAPYVDSFFIMAYDYHWQTSPIAGAVSPLEGNTYNVTKTVNDYILLTNSKEFILGLPLYGYDWWTESGDKGSKTILYAGNELLTKTVTINNAVEK